MHGVHVHGFPSLFIEGLSQGARLISNITHNLNDAGKSIAGIIVKAIETDATEVEVTEEGERAWMELVDSGPEALLSSPDCTPGYYNNEGQPPTPADRRNAGGHPGGPVAYFNYIKEWRDSEKFEGLEFRHD
jgi:hypothetical protein